MGVREVCRKGGVHSGKMRNCQPALTLESSALNVSKCISMFLEYCMSTIRVEKTLLDGPTKHLEASSGRPSGECIRLKLNGQMGKSVTSHAAICTNQARPEA